MKTITFDETRWKLVPVEPTKEWVENLADRTLRIRGLAKAIEDVLSTAPQPAATIDDEPVAWVRRHPSGELSAEYLHNNCIEELRKRSGAWVPLYTRAQAATSDDARDAINNWLDTCDESGSSIQHRIECAGLNEVLAWVERAFNAGRDSVERAPTAEREQLIDAIREFAKNTTDDIPDDLWALILSATKRPVERVPLSKEQIDSILLSEPLLAYDFVRRIEAAHGIKGES